MLDKSIPAQLELPYSETVTPSLPEPWGRRLFTAKERYMWCQARDANREHEAIDRFRRLRLPGADVRLPHEDANKKNCNSHQSGHNDRKRGLRRRTKDLVRHPHQRGSPFQLGPGLVFGLGLDRRKHLSSRRVATLKLSLLTERPGSGGTLIIFSSSRRLAAFHGHLRVCGSSTNPRCNRLSAVRSLVPLRPDSHQKQLLRLRPIRSNRLTTLSIRL